jgi:hypothetical protein
MSDLQPKGPGMSGNPSFKLESIAVENAIKVFATAIDDYKQIHEKLTTVCDDLRDQWLVGQTGNAAADALAKIQERIKMLEAHCEKLHKALADTLTDVNDQIDPGIGSRFQGRAS